VRPHLRRRVVGLSLALLAAPVIYLGLAVVLGLVPVNRDFRETPDGIPIYLRTNGVHAELVLPTRAAGIDWSVDHPPGEFRRLDEPLPWVAFGWGDRGFYLSTPTWRDLRLSTALVALTGLGEGAMHVEYIERPDAYAVARIGISETQYRRLAAFVRDSFRRAPTGRPVKIDAPGYLDTDAFYEAVPRYRLWYTCNEWVRAGLAGAGIRTAVWAPWDTALFWQTGR